MSDRGQTILKIFPDGKVLYQQECAGVFLEDPLNDNHFKPGKFKNKKDNFKVFKLKNNDILLIGGETGDSLLNRKPIREIEKYNPLTGEISMVSSLNYNVLNEEKISEIRNRKTPEPVMLEDSRLLFPGFDGEDIAYLLLYDLEKKNIIKKVMTFNFKSISLFNNNKVLLTLSPLDLDDVCRYRLCSFLVDLEKIEPESGTDDKKSRADRFTDFYRRVNAERLSNVCPTFPYQQLISLHDGTILVTGGAECFAGNEMSYLSKKAFLLILQ